MKYAKLCVQCSDDQTEKVGSFLAEPVQNKRLAISPIFSDVRELFVWCRVEGWKQEPFNHEFPVGYYSRP